MPSSYATSPQLKTKKTTLYWFPQQSWQQRATTPTLKNLVQYLKIMLLSIRENHVLAKRREAAFSVSPKEGILRNFPNWELNGLRQGYFFVLLKAASKTTWDWT